MRRPWPPFSISLRGLVKAHRHGQITQVSDPDHEVSDPDHCLSLRLRIKTRMSFIATCFPAPRHESKSNFDSIPSVAYWTSQRISAGKGRKTMKMFPRLGTLAALIALAFLFNPDVTHAQNSQGCAWPIEWSAEGIGNWAIPDTYARWWVMPFDNYQTMTIKGTYPNARFFSWPPITRMIRRWEPASLANFTMSKSPLIRAATTRS